MTQNYWRSVLLFDLNGEKIGKARVPGQPFPPALVKCGNRYFTLALPDGNYAETKCFLLAEENIFPGASQEMPTPFRKADK